MRRFAGAALGASLLFGCTHNNHPTAETLRPAISSAKGIGQIAIPETLRIEPQPAMPPTTLALPKKHKIVSPPESGSEVYEQQANAAYIQTVLSQPLAEAGLTIVTPINQDVEAVNQPNQFIVTADGLHGSQFNVNDLLDEGKKVVAIAASGPLPIIANGKLYGKAMYDGRLAHQENGQINGAHFDPSDPAAAVSFIVQETTRAEQVTTAPAQLDEITPQSVQPYSQ